MDDQTRIELEAAAFRALREHLMDKRTDVQNIDLMNLAGFCRNCLSRWYMEAANERGIEMSKDEAREAWQYSLDNRPPAVERRKLEEKLASGLSAPAPEKRPLPDVSLTDGEVDRQDI